MSYFPFRLTAYDKWSKLKINKVNAPQLWQYISGWGGVYIYNGDDESIGGGAFGQDGIAECCEGVEDIGPAPYKAEIHGYLCDKQYCIVTPGSNTVYLDVYSIKDFSFWDVKTGAPIGIAELFGSLIQVRMLVNGQQANDTLGNPLVYTGDGSYARFSHIKAGRYDLEITGSYFSEAHYERNITVGLMEAFEKPTTNYYYTNPALPQVKQPKWADYKLTWEDVENALSYIVRLYNNAGGVVATKTIAPGMRVADFSSELSAGTFTATVQASEVAISE